MRGIEAVMANKKRSPVTEIRPNSLAVADFTRSMDFYRRGLGLMLKKQVGNLAEFDLAGSAFILRGGGEGGTGSLTVTTKDLSRVEESLQAWGSALTMGPEEREHGSVRALVGITSDPEGNTLEIVQFL